MAGNNGTSAYRRSGHRSGARRLVPQDYRGREGRNSGLKNTINTMVDQLDASPRKSPVWRAKWVPKASWAAGRRCRKWPAHRKDLTDNVNFMAGNLTAQVRNIAEVATAIAAGDLSKITVDVRGEILLKETLNTMVRSSFAPSPPK